MPSMDVNIALEKFLTVHKPLKVAYGGRGSGKSIGFGDMLTFKMATERADIYCLREYQDSLSGSVHRVFKDSIQKRLKLDGWGINQSSVTSPEGAQTRYIGAARNPDSIQSAEGYKYSWFEEAHRASEASLDKLLPTILRNIGSECWFSGNPQSSGDPFAQRFIVPYQKELEKNGIYEDDIHLIVKVNWRNNPWWNEAQEQLRLWDFEHLSRAKYDWIWEGAFNDHVDDSIIKAEWFDAAVDAHIKLGFKAFGPRVCAHDPSDLGTDDKAVAIRHGSVVEQIETRDFGDVNEGCDWAMSLAVESKSDFFVWDGDGLGLSLRRQVREGLSGTQINFEMFRGSQSADDNYTGEENEALYFKNKRAEHYWMLRDRFYKTYRAVEKGEYIDPDQLISLSSNIESLRQVRSEVCRIPRKFNPNGVIQIMTKPEMAKMKINSPNMADALMMSLSRAIGAINTADEYKSQVATRFAKLNRIKKMLA